MYSTLVGNQATARSGGGLYNAGTLTVMHNTFAGSQATAGSGGGLDNGGTLTVETRRTHFDEGSATRKTGQSAGDYILLQVIDTGHGMDAETLERIFEPFFSKKQDQPGKKHSGLGLATVFGIVRGHGGAIRVESKPDHGATFSVWLPVGKSMPVDETSPAPAALPVTGGNETILIVDDEAPIRELMERVLGQYGYHVLAAADGPSGVQQLRANRAQIDLVILDLVMPGLSGLKTFQLMREIDPEVKVLVSTGYSDKGQAKDVLSQGAQGFMQKPFTLHDMLRKVRTVLDECRKQNP